MRIRLDYGRTGLDVNLPDDRVVGPLAIRPAPPLADPEAAIARALAQPTGTPPLAEIARGRRNACILVCDITRPVPNRLILPPVLRTLEEQGIRWLVRDGDTLYVDRNGNGDLTEPGEKVAAEKWPGATPRRTATTASTSAT